MTGVQTCALPIYRFKAAVAQRGCYNFTSFYGTSDIGPWFGDYILGGPVYEREALFRACSPITYAHNITTPLRLIHSENDLRCPMEQAEQLFVALKRLGRTVRFPDEDHDLSRTGRPRHRLARFRIILEWFARYVPPGGSGDPDRPDAVRDARP